jgi:hypothetical protein
MKRFFLLTLLTICSALPCHAENTGLLILLGVNDSEPTQWDGNIAVNEGSVGEVSGWRFERDDAIKGKAGWTCSTHHLQVKPGRANNPKKLGMAKRAQQMQGPMQDNGVVAKLVNVSNATEVKLVTPQGEATFKLSDVTYGKRVPLLDGRVAVMRTASGRQMSPERTDDDFPSLAMDDKAAVLLSYQSFTPGLDRDERAKGWDEAPADLSFLAKPTGGDQLWVQVRAGGEWGAPVAVTDKGCDIYKSAVAPDGAGGAWVTWAERKEGNFDVFARHLEKGKLGDVINLSQSPGNDVSPVATRDAKGRIWVSWMGAKGSVFQIFATTLEGGKWGTPVAVSSNQGNCWDPAIASTGDRVAIAWDTYEKGDYDIWMREITSTAPAVAVANTPDYEARPTLTFDTTGALWIAWEESGPTWGKDWGAYDGADGIGLYRDRQIGMRVWKDGQWMEPASPIDDALPGALAFSGTKFNRGAPARNPEQPDGVNEEAFLQPAARKGAPGSHAEAKGAGTFNNLGRIVCAQDGRLWCFVRARQNNSRGTIGSVWMTAAAYYDGDKWTGPILVPHSENLIYNLPALAAGKLGVLVAHSTDHRVDRLGEFSKAKIPGGKGGNAALNASKDPFDNDIYFSTLATPAGEALPLVLKPATSKPLDNPQPSKRTIAERAEVKAIREYRADYAGKPLQILRGEFHRHTEISGDGGGDGPLEDMWRYGIDASAMDWLGNGDHDNGGGREYSWWLTQKTTDAFMLPGSFTPMFSYERSVSYPEGHRNCVFVQRGVRTLPRLPISDPKVFASAPDTEMLYKYLHLFNGVCASHTSVGSMGTDWRNNDPEVEPMVEVYQGARQNYEYPGCPRCPTENDAIGGWEPAGFICNALLKGVKFSFQSSSDHGSTHISYAMVYAENASREAIHAAMKLRHTYGATDNIIADTRCKAADGTLKMMGDEFSVKGAPTIEIKLVGTAPFAKVTLVKDNVEVPLTGTGKADFTASWTDPKPETGKSSYYYVRGEQTNGELVWASPMWIKSE